MNNVLNPNQRYILKDKKTNHIVSCTYDEARDVYIVPWPGTRSTMEYPSEALKDHFVVLRVTLTIDDDHVIFTH